MVTVHSNGYTESATPLVVLEASTAVITQKTYGRWRAYAIGLDFGFLLLKDYNNRADEIVQTYDNHFDPTLDVWLRLPILARGEG